MAQKGVDHGFCHLGVRQGASHGVAEAMEVGVAGEPQAATICAEPLAEKAAALTRRSGTEGHSGSSGLGATRSTYSVNPSLISSLCRGTLRTDAAVLTFWLSPSSVTVMTRMSPTSSMSRRRSCTSSPIRAPL